MDGKVRGQRHGFSPCDHVYLLKLLSKPQVSSSFRELFLGSIKEIRSPLSRLLDFRCRFLEHFDSLSLARATKLQLCVSRQPVILHICPSAFDLRPVSEPCPLLQFVPLRRHSPTVRTLLRPWETRDRHPLAVYGIILIYLSRSTRYLVCGFREGPLFHD